MEEKQITFKDLVDINELKGLFEKFTAITGFKTSLVDHITEELLIATGWSNICVKFHRNYPDSNKQCIASARDLTSGLMQAGEIRVHHCRNGFVDGCTPIIIKGRHFANLLSGQVLFALPDIEQFRRQAQKYGYNEEEYLAYLDEIPIITEEEFREVLSYLADVASMIAKTGLANFEMRKEAAQQNVLLQTISKSAPVGIGLVVDRVFQWTNQKMTQLTGYTSAELAGQSSRMIYLSDDDYNKAGKLKYAEISKFGAGSVDTRFERKDGSIIDVDLSSTPLVAGSLEAGVIFTALDITDRKRAERDIIRAKEEWIATFDAMADIVTIQDKNMRIIRANKATYDFFKAEYGDLDGQFCYELFTGASTPCTKCPILETLKTNGNQSLYQCFTRHGAGKRNLDRKLISQRGFSGSN